MSNPSHVRTSSPYRLFGFLSFETWMILPALLLLAGISLYPFFYLLWMSLNDVSLMDGLHLKWDQYKNWTTLFADGNVGRSWLVAFKYFFFAVGLEMLLGTLVALALSELTRGREVLMSVFADADVHRAGHRRVAGTLPGRPGAGFVLLRAAWIALVRW